MANISTDTGYVDNWQSGKTVTECNLHMLTSEDCSDVTFLVGSENLVVRAHRYVLVSRSCVFHAMFCGPLAEEGEVTIPDIEPGIFKEFLRYVYTDIADISADNVSGLLYTSRKYAVDALLNKCTHFLKTSLSEDNVCQVLEQCHGYGETDLEEKALKILTGAGEKVVSSAGFIDLCSDCLGKFLKSEDLGLKEEQIFEGTLSWTKHACQKDDVPVTHENMRKYLGEMVYEIRFVSMSSGYLVNVVGQSHVLSDSERIRIMDKRERPSVDISPFKTSARKTTQSTPKAVTSPVQYVRRFKLQQVSLSSSGTHAISFSANRNVKLVGFQLYGPATGQTLTCIITVSLTREDGSSITHGLLPDTEIVLQGGGRQTDILFPDAISLEAGSTYTLSVTVPWFYSYSGSGGRQSVHVDGVTFTFTNSPDSKAFTSVSKGQIPGLLFEHAW